MHNTRLCQQHVCVRAEEEAERRGCWFWSQQKRTHAKQLRGHCQSLSQTGAPSNTHTRHPCKRPQTHARYTCAREPSHETPVARVWPRAWDQEHTTGPSQNDITTNSFFCAKYFLIEQMNMRGRWCEGAVLQPRTQERGVNHTC
jgi:hypothetical protein